MRCCILLFAFTLFFSQPLLSEDAAKRPNIVFIFADDHAYQAMSCYPRPLALNETPNLDRLARSGMRFDRCLVTNSICGPSRAVILTGKYSHANGFYTNNFSRFDGSQSTFPSCCERLAIRRPSSASGIW